MSEGLFCKNCFEPLQVNHVKEYEVGLCTGEVYCEYCNLTYSTKVCCDDFSDYLALDESYDDEVYWDSE